VKNGTVVGVMLAEQTPDDQVAYKNINRFDYKWARHTGSVVKIVMTED